MAKFCSNCGAALNSVARFCANCGARVSPDESAQSSSGRNNYDDLLTAGVGALAGAAVATASNSAYAQPNAAPITAPPPTGDVNNFFGFASERLEDITGAVDVTNIVGHVAHSFGIDNLAEYADIVADGANELLDAAADAVGDAVGEVAGEVAGEAAGDIVGSLFDLLG